MIYFAYKLASRLPNYIRRFGIINGLRLLFLIERGRRLPAKSDIIKSIQVPGFAHPIYLRECTGDHAIFFQCLVMNQYDFSKLPHAQRLNEKYAVQVQENKTPLIIDCGGNIGLSVIWFARQYPKATIVAIEPDSENIKLLELNTNSFSNRITILHGGVWRTAGLLRISNPDSGTNAYRVEAIDTRVSAEREFVQPTGIRCYTIPEICTLRANSNPLIVKIDIEGSQKELFRENTEWVGSTDLITLELDDWLLPWQGTSRPFFKCLSQYSYEYLLNGESIFCFRDEAAFDA